VTRRRPDPWNLAGWALIAAVCAAAVLAAVMVAAAWATKETDR
jgi:disulfide bond formation protein DsbB